MRCPQRLKGEARDYWQRNAPALIEAGVLNSSNVDNFMLLCQTWAHLQQADSNVNIVDDANRSKERMWYNGLHKNYQALAKQFKAVAKGKSIDELIAEGLGE